MANYTELRGLRVKYVSSNPSPGGSGEVWYNTTDKALRAFVGRAAFSSGPDCITTRGDGGGTGTQSASVIFGGFYSPPASYKGDTEEYNGAGWYSSGSLNTNRSALGSATNGSQTAALAFGGNTGSNPGRDECESYDGSTWTEVANLPGGIRLCQGGAGTQTAALRVAGYTGSRVNSSDEWDGSSWTAGGNLNTSKSQGAGVGLQTAAIYAGGFSTTTLNETEEYNGTSWTEVSNIGTARYEPAGMFGIQDDCVLAGGYPARNHTEGYDGTSWSEIADLSSGRSAGMIGAGSSAGNGLTGLVATGYTTAYTGKTEEFNNSFQVVTAGAWASGGNLPVANKFMGGGGTQTAGIASGGQIVPGSIVGETYEYDGSAWTDASADMGNSKLGRASCGTQTANLVAGGQPDTAAVEEYNGTSWAEQTDIPGARDAAGMAGIQTAAIFTGGDYPNGNNNAETFEYDGSSWTDTTDIPTAVRAHAMFGTQSAAVVCGGYTSTTVVTTYEWDDSSWTTGGNMATARYGAIGCGTQTDGLIAGGEQPAYSTSTEGYDGSVWSTRPSMATARQLSGEASSGPSSLTMGTGGATSSAGEGVVNTEEFTGDTAVTTASAIDFD